jgi:hypothetical protein
MHEAPDGGQGNDSLGDTGEPEATGDLANRIERELDLIAHWEKHNPKLFGRSKRLEFAATWRTFSWTGC